MRARHLLACAAGALIVAACATAGPPPSLLQAKSLYATLQSQGATRRAEGPMIRTEQAIALADNAQAEGRMGEYIAGLSDIALRTAQEAEAENARVLARAAADSLRAERDQKLLSLTAAQRDQLAQQNQHSQTEIANLREKNTQVEQRADSLKAAADSAQARLNGALNQLRSLVVEITNLQQTSRGLVVSLSDVLFDVDQATLKPGNESKLRQIAAVLQQYPNNQISVEGHTDATGSDAHNQKLSEDRAASVRLALVSGGIEAGRITSRGFGKTQPVATNASPEGRQRNRRVEIVVLGAGTVGDAVKADSAKADSPAKPPR